MSDYQPTSRRPIADVFRRTAGSAVRFCVRHNIHPDAVSYASMVAATAAGACFWQAADHPWMLLLGSFLCYLRLWCNMLDGMVALASGKASRRGEILNDLPDRVSDVVIFAGVAHSGLCCVAGGYWVAIMAVLTAYVGTFGQAVGVQREYSGLMAKPWRMVALSIGAAITFALLITDRPIRYGGETVLDWTNLVILLGCTQTIAIRLKRIMAALDAKQGRGGGGAQVQSATSGGTTGSGPSGEVR
jgi:phosphatidylglycerophosphate synthase